MKKILLTSGAALLLSAGYAAADTISFAGDGRMGVVYDRNAENEFRIDSRVRGYFFFDAETDTGLGFGGRLRLGDAPFSQGNDVASGANHVYVESSFGRVEVGDVASAAQAAVGDLSSVGFTGLGFQNETDFLMRNFNGGLVADGAYRQRNKALYTYDLDAFSIYGSTGPIDSVISVYSIGASYDAGMFAVGAGFEYADSDDDTVPLVVLGERATGNAIPIVFGGSATHFTGSVEASFDAFSVKATGGYAGSDLGDELDDLNAQQWQAGIGASASFDQYTVTAFARRDFFKEDHLGLGASYDLGGGARLEGGVRHTSYPSNTLRGDTGDLVSSDTFADLGVNMSF